MPAPALSSSQCAGFNFRLRRAIVILFAPLALGLITGVGVIAAPSVSGTSERIVNILPGGAGNPTEGHVFSDANEVTASDSSVVAEPAPGGGVRLVYKINGYGGIVLREGDLDIARLATLRFRIRQIEGETTRPLLQFTSHGGSRCFFPVDVTPAGEAGAQQAGEAGAQQAGEAAFGHFTAFNAPLLADARQIALVLPAGKGVIDIETLEFVTGGEIDASALPPYPSKTKIALPPGLGAWTYGTPVFVVGEVARYNADAPADRRLRYLFQHSGTIEIPADGKPVFHWNAGRAAALQAALREAGQNNVHVLPMIDGLTANVSRVSGDEWKRIAAEVGAVIEPDAASFGVHFDLEPHDPHVYLLFSHMREFTAKPVTAAVAHSSPDLFRYTDMGVLMGYDYAYTPEDFRVALTAKVNDFLAHAREGRGLAMIGLPAIATHHEMESVADTMKSPRESTGFNMADFVTAGLDVTEAALRGLPAANGHFTGYSVWAIHEPEALHAPSDTRYYFPGHVSPPVWQLFVERGRP